MNVFHGPCIKKSFLNFIKVQQLNIFVPGITKDTCVKFIYITSLTFEYLEK